MSVQYTPATACKIRTVDLWENSDFMAVRQLNGSYMIVKCRTGEPGVVVDQKEMQDRAKESQLPLVISQNTIDNAVKQEDAEAKLREVIAAQGRQMEELKKALSRIKNVRDEDVIRGEYNYSYLLNEIDAVDELLKEKGLSI